MLADSHCHIYLEQFEKDLDQVLDRARKAGVEHIFMPAITFASLEQMDALPSDSVQFHRMAGIHPTEINEGTRAGEEELLAWCSREDIVAVGETGLDYYWSSEYVREQKESLRMHCRVARAVGKPVVLHNRESTGDLLELIASEQDGSLKGVWHCFTGTADEGRRALDLGLKLGIGGVLTFKNAGVDRAVRELPLEEMMLETDAPYLAPSPRRGDRNEPAFMAHTARKLAEVLEVTPKEVEEKTFATTLRFFGIEP